MKSLLVLVCGVMVGSALYADDINPSPGILQMIPPDAMAVDYVYSLPLGKVPGQGPWPGIRAEYDLPSSPWGIELGYAYRGKQYYDYDHASHSWEGPLLWQQIDSEGVSEGDWPFFQTRHVFSPGVLFRGRWLWFRPRLALGLLIQTFVPGGASEYYPDYGNQFNQYVGRTKVVFGNGLKLGVDGLLWNWLDYGVDLVFEVPDWSEFYDAVQYSLAAYAQTNAHFELKLGIRL